MIVMPANATGWFWHSLARESGRLGHLYSPDAQRGPWDWFPYALDNGAFSCWEPKANTFDGAKWSRVEGAWRRMLCWATAQQQRPRWAIVPDVPGNREATLERWPLYAQDVTECRIPLAIAVQDGMTPGDVRQLVPAPAVICVGGSTEWKWGSVEMWAAEFERVHVLRCNAPDKLAWMETMGIESTDGTGWNRGDRKQTAGVEEWARSKASPVTTPLWPHVCRAGRKDQLIFA